MKFIFLINNVFRLTLCLLLAAVSAQAASAPFDYDGDGKTDILVRRLNENKAYVWYALNSRDEFAATVFGGILPDFGDSSVADDYDGDGKTDIAVVRNRGGQALEWIILNSRDNTLTFVPWGINNRDRPVPQDYDGDGKADIAVYRSGWWYVRRSSDQKLYAEQFGRDGIVGTNAPVDMPLQGGDYDGDGKADLAIRRLIAPNPAGTAIPMSLYLRLSRDGSWAVYELGNAQGTGVLSGDYDGDGRADVAIWQGNLWLWIRSSDNKLDGVRFGVPNLDTPMPGDYDGDGKTDPAVYRRGDGSCAPPQQQSYFYFQQSRDGFKAIPWGLTCDDAEASRRYIRAEGF